MADFLYCISNPSVPGVVRIDKSNTNPRQGETNASSRTAAQRIEWVVAVADGDASLIAFHRALAAHADPSWPGHYHCDPIRARAVAVQFTTEREIPTASEATGSALPSLVIGLGLSVQFLGMINGHMTAPSAALIASALFWVVYTLPIGSGGQAKMALS